MDPITSLHVATQRRADYERRATEHRLARSLRPRRMRPSLTVRRPRPATAPAPLSCCPA